MPLEIVRNDITRMRVDAIVNAANERLLMGGGVCGAIFAAAGAEALTRACSKIGFCETGRAVITHGFALPAKYVIHAIGPVWRGGAEGERELLASCYDSALALAQRHGCKSIAFPLISSGIYGFPKDVALSIATARIGAFLRENEMQVYLVVFDRASFQLSEQRYRSIQSYIDDHYVSATAALYTRRFESMPLSAAMPPSANRPASAKMPASCDSIQPTISHHAPAPSNKALEQMLKRAGESFTQRLLRLIDERAMTDPEVYQRANIDRRLFSKIRSNRDYRPAKNTALALAVALRLNLDDTADLLQRAGYALSPSSHADLIVEYFLREENYDIFEINEALFAFDENLLGS